MYRALHEVINTHAQHQQLLVALSLQVFILSALALSLFR
jgi:hypothetical protein